MCVGIREEIEDNLQKSLLHMWDPRVELKIVGLDSEHFYLLSRPVPIGRISEHTEEL